MNAFRYIFILLACTLAFSAGAGNSPVTTAGMVLNATISPANTNVPVTVTNFTDIGSFTLTLDYYSTRLTYVSSSPNPAFTGMTVTVSSPGRLLINWPQCGMGITLPDQAILLNITFNYNINGVSAPLDWYDDGTSCRFSKYAGGSYTSLDDTPAATHYIGGGVTNHAAPVTLAPVITNAATGTVAVPVRVAGFSNIGSIYLTLVYSSNVLTYVNFTQNGSVPGSIIVGSIPYTTNKRMMTMSWYGNGFNLPDSSILLTLNFTYASTAGNASYSELVWYDDDGASCSYSDPQFNVLYDARTSWFYRDGLVASRRAPQAWLPYMKNAVPGTTVSLPVNVSGFNNIRSCSLSFGYDPAVATYNNYSADAALTGISVTDIPSGSKRKVVMAWTGASSLSLPDGTPVVTFSFDYLSGTTGLTWITGDVTSCRFNDNAGNAYYDFPKSSHYHDGLVTSQAAPLTIAGYASPSPGQQVTVPVVAYWFLVIGHWSLVMDYDPGVLTYQSAALVPEIGGSFSATSPGPGRIAMSWSGTAAMLPDSSTLFNLTFTYNGGESALAWHDDGSSCQYAAGVSDPALYDTPQSAYYINGYIGPSPLVANFTADNVSPALNANVNFNSGATGSPVTWYWGISPSTYKFVNGTNEYSINPKVQFSANGAYTIIMAITRGSAGGVKVRKDYIVIGTAGLWTGATSGDWHTSANWSNNMVPGSLTDVTIPTSASNWPVVSGNLALGVQCGNLTMEGNSQLTVEGDFSIGSGKTLAITGKGTLIIGGDWLNSGVFNEGRSTVNFTGSEDATLYGGASETFSDIIVSKSEARLSIQGTVMVNGNFDQL